MNKISLRKVIPNVFSDAEVVNSGIWSIDVDFERGKSYLIEAASGKGKSSLCSFIYGYRSDYKGDINFSSKNIRSFTPSVWDYVRTNELGLLFQELNLFPELTAMENVVLKNNLTDYKTESQIESMFDALGIGEKKNQLIGKMSWGQQQRVAVIRCLCQPLHFLIMDEPISHLDDENASAVSDLVSMELSAQGAGLIVTSIGKDMPFDYTEKISL
ncbi:MAG: ATP-binding cassette domain-containing protein [Dysgonomonas sp.]